MLNRSTGKTALVLAGGGLTGAVYHIGALRAMDDLLIDRTVNDFDIFVGTSAGALISSFLANGFTPEEMLTTLDGSHPELKPIKREDIFSLNQLELLQWGLKFPFRLLETGYAFLRSRGDMTFFDVLWEMTEAIPPGLYDGLGLERYVRELLESQGRSNRFQDLEKDLFTIATDLDTGERVVFGKNMKEDVPISLSVAASSALPLLYRPVRIGEREYVDGSLGGTASIDLAVERGATLIVCINPMVPFDNSDRDYLPLFGGESQNISEKGIRGVSDQVLRIISHSGLKYHIKQISRRHPEVDIILIEPRTDDARMFYNNIMRYSARLEVARHGFETVTLDLAEDYSAYKGTLARHGIPISRWLVIEELAEIQQAGYDPVVIRRVLEAKSKACSKRNSNSPSCQLSRSLAELDLLLDNIRPD